MKTGRVLTLTLGLSVLMGAAQLRGQATDFFDNFDDGNVADASPVTWNTNPLGVFPGDYDASSGDYVLRPEEATVEDEIMVAWVPSVDLQVVGSVRTRGRILSDEGNLGVVLYLDANTISAYAVVLDAGGNLIVTRTIGGSILEIGSVDLSFNATEDVYVQLNHDSLNLSAEAWRVGDPQPEEPQITIPDVTFSGGPAGIVFAEDEFQDSGVFEIAQAANIPRILTGDLNLDTLVDGNDIDALFDNLGGDDALFDWDEDGDIELLDIDTFIRDFFGTEYGDANLDGRVDADDLAIIEANLFTPGSGWSRGDFNGDDTTDGRDFNIWNMNKGFGVAAANAVPEPASGVATLFLLATLAMARRRVM